MLSRPNRLTSGAAVLTSHLQMPSRLNQLIMVVQAVLTSHLNKLMLVAVVALAVPLGNVILIMVLEAVLTFHLRMSPRLNQFMLMAAPPHNVFLVLHYPCSLDTDNGKSH